MRGKRGGCSAYLMGRLHARTIVKWRGRERETKTTGVSSRDLLLKMGKGYKRDCKKSKSKEKNDLLKLGRACNLQRRTRAVEPKEDKSGGKGNGEMGLQNGGGRASFFAEKARLVKKGGRGLDVFRRGKHL